MQEAKIKASLDILKRIEVYNEKVGVESQDKSESVPDLPAEFDQSFAGEFLSELAETANTKQIQEFYEREVRRNSEPSRSLEVLDLISQSYEFVSNHWGEIFFLLSFLNRSGKLERLKKNPQFKLFLEMLFEEKEKEEDKDKN